ncbi:MAG: DUF4333 domain-containing protein [Solirubrobacterales bacterium]|nr:DUF4333 domain-containing protein [Solirubrobacterales bacterium]
MALAAVLLGAIAWSGCGETTVSQDELTGAIKTQYKEKTGATITEISCDEVKAEKGAKLSCDATNNSKAELHITGEVTGVNEDDKAEFDWKLASAKVPGDLFEQTSIQLLESQLGVSASSVSCPEMIEIKVGNKVDCKVTEENGTEHEAVLTLTDGQGGFRIAMKSE